MAQYMYEVHKRSYKETGMKLYYERDEIEIYHGDCLDIIPNLKEKSFDACIADFPYEKKYLHLYDGVALGLKRLLVRGGSYFVIVPHYALYYPEIKSISDHLKYRWIFSMWQVDGPHPRMAMGMEIVWKPILWFVNAAWTQGRGFPVDGFINQPPAKKHHKWEQSEDWATFCLKKVPEGGRVLDPTVGAGTVLLKAVEMGYQAVGIDVDEECCEIAAKRVDEAIDNLT